MSFIPLVDLARNFFQAIYDKDASKIHVTCVDYTPTDPTDNKAEVSQPTAASLNATVVGASGVALAKDSTLTDKSQTTQVIYGGSAIDPRSIRALTATDVVTANAQSQLCPTTPSGRAAITATHAETSAIGTAGLYSLVATDDCYVAIAASPVAAVDGSGGTRLLQRGAVLYARLTATDKISLLGDVAGGYLYYAKEGA